MPGEAAGEQPGELGAAHADGAGGGQRPVQHARGPRRQGAQLHAGAEPQQLLPPVPSGRAAHPGVPGGGGASSSGRSVPRTLVLCVVIREGRGGAFPAQ